MQTRAFAINTTKKLKSLAPNVCFLCNKGKHWVSNCKIIAERLNDLLNYNDVFYAYEKDIE